MLTQHHLLHCHLLQRRKVRHGRLQCGPHPDLGPADQRGFLLSLLCYLALPHPSPRNNRWLVKNPWFESEVLPRLQREVQKALTQEDAT